MSLSIERNEGNENIASYLHFYRLGNAKQIKDRAVSDSDKQRAR